ncbi:aspartyl-tRNA(Asn)/glutamyl-tRNA(Gln) amidotransferase subunit C [Thermonema lapsum]|jgi:aspartyl-tRNA(Asn)/glutamyl-tRNA(Gln) amidotransferase subunit C|uniref:Aspartyl/glutamyl-tRNA(Asn/Gln) amidotransferase subunit C n=1 Tax=Thermonema lapsum TaxID=28195 RepID=A0A846MSV6_9BACT|nr:Asp-tRNA(Asn)/Glu-tRNA(Gln) amidotransferase subunit GatC [Thermonema lapsum]NIK74519.1 aspartyl-tRNA(Asn)/glutamyl-tRNA(Gln) amidotransferase subunit C [Thermonema lapsum]
MKVSLDTLQKIAHLARLEFDESEAQTMLNDLNKIIEWVDQLEKIDTNGVEPLIHMSEENNVLREDEPAPALPHARALRNAPKKDSNYFRVPKVIE